MIVHTCIPCFFARIGYWICQDSVSIEKNIPFINKLIQIYIYFWQQALDAILTNVVLNMLSYLSGDIDSLLKKSEQPIIQQIVGFYDMGEFTK